MARRALATKRVAIDPSHVKSLKRRFWTPKCREQMSGRFEVEAELITASCTRTFSDDMMAMRRVQDADECAVRNNIEAFLTELSASVLQ